MRVPLENIILAETNGYDMLTRLVGPVTLLQCAKKIGIAERALELLCKRAKITYGMPYLWQCAHTISFWKIH